MDSRISQNGHAPHTGEHEPVNAYADALRGEHPPEIVEFELNTDPYANMVPRAPRGAAGHGSRLDWEDEEPRRRNPWLVAISAFMIVILLLPLIVAVFVRLGL